MDILNWLRIKKENLIRTTLDSPQDLLVFGADVSFEKRGDKYQSYAVPASDFAQYIQSTLPTPNPFLFSSPVPLGNNSTTGTQVLQVALIPANTLSSTAFTLEIAGQTERILTSGPGTITSNIYVNTSNTLLGASLLATCNSLTTTNCAGSFIRTFNFNGTTLNGTTASTQVPSDYTGNIGTQTSFDPTVANYFLFTTTNASPGVVSTVPTVRILKY